MNGYSFCVVTSGKRPRKLAYGLDSIRALKADPCEILVAGNVNPVADVLSERGAVSFPMSAEAVAGRLGAMRNALVDAASYDRCVIMDDDVALKGSFVDAVSRPEARRCDLLAVRLENPDGTRYWDWSTFGGPRGHLLLDYDESDEYVYVTGGASVVKTEIARSVRWDSSLGFYQGEDVEFCRRVQAASCTVGVCSTAVAVHLDHRFTQCGRRVIRLTDADAGDDLDACLDVANAVASYTAPQVIEGTTFKHSGARGDLIYGLPTIKCLGGGTLCLNLTADHYLGRPITFTDFLSFRELLVEQPYIKDVVVWNGDDVTYDIDEFREYETETILLSQWQLETFGQTFDLSQPWLTVEPMYLADIVVNRSPRYHGPFEWSQLRDWQHAAVFLGFEEEYAAFVHETGLGEVKRQHVGSVLEATRIIAGAKLFVGNQSFCYSLAEALKVPRVQEVCMYAPNCLPQSDNGHIRLDQTVLRHYVLGDAKEPPRGRKWRSCRLVTFQQVRDASFRGGRKLAKTPKLAELPGRHLVDAVVLAGDSEDWADALEDVVGSVTDELPEEAVRVVCWGAGALSRQRELASVLGDFPAVVLHKLVYSTREEAANAAIEEARGDVVVFVSGDVSLRRRWSRMAVRELLGSLDAGMVGPSLTFSPTSPHIEPDCFAVSRRAYEHVGLFRLGVNDPAAELGQRLVRAGYKLKCQPTMVYA